MFQKKLGIKALAELNNKKKPSASEWLIRRAKGTREREGYTDCFNSLASHINETIIISKQVYLLKDILEMYQFLPRWRRGV